MKQQTKQNTLTPKVYETEHISGMNTKSVMLRPVKQIAVI